jgi:DNA-binding CsgD family transcriptional regulator
MKASGLSSEEIAQQEKIQVRAVWRSMRHARLRAGLNSTEQIIARLVLEGSIVINDNGEFTPKSL